MSGGLADLSTPALLAREDQLLAELGAVRAEVRRRLAALPAEVPEAPIGLEDLARRLGWLAGRGGSELHDALRAARERLRRSAWAWLRALGERHRAGRSPRWLWSEVAAEMARRREEI